MIFYTWFYGYGRAVLADDLGVDDLLSLEPAEIVDRIVAAGHTPWIETPQTDLLPTVGTVTDVESEGLSYIVSVNRNAQVIDVQERREEAYDKVE